MRHLLSALMYLLAAGSAAAHPLDALSPGEIAAATAVLRETGLVGATTRFSLIALDEPDKAAVVAWRPGQPFTRKAFVVARHDRTVYEAVVDLATRTFERWQAVPDAHPPVALEELAAAQRITMADAEWQAAMSRRGFQTIKPGDVFCAPLPGGPAADPAEAGRRLLRVICFDAAGTGSLWSRPIEGLTAVVDLDERRVIRVIDTGPVPVSREAHDFGAAPIEPRPAAKPPYGDPRFTVDGGATGATVRWKNWSFHYRLDRRGGLVLSLLRVHDGKRDRMVLYRGSLAEMFVPYMDLDPNWAFRAWFDVGENDFGFLASSLMPEIDCPTDATFGDALLADSQGDPQLGKSVVCLFERESGAPLWRHAGGGGAGHAAAYAGKKALELVLRTIATAGNYDYILDWVLTEAGTVRIDIGATGIDAVKGVAARNMADPSAANDSKPGMLVAPQLVAVNHDHFLSFRLDLDIDGAPNTLVRLNLVPEPAEAISGMRSRWRIEEETIREEGWVAPGRHGAAEIWRVLNPNLTNRLGQHPGYELRLGHSAVSLLPPQDPAQRRAGFAAAPLWVTAYNASELYAAGPYPNQSRGGDGLPAYAARRRPVENADIVVWATMGFHHLPRPEDWPVLPTVWHSLSLVPYGFFDRNPSLAPPPSTNSPADRQ